MQLTASSGSTGAHVGDRTARTFFNNENDRGVAPQEAWPGDWCLMIVQQRANQRAPTLRSVEMFEVHLNNEPHTSVNLCNLDSLLSQQLTWSPASAIRTLEGSEFNLANLITVQADFHCSTASACVRMSAKPSSSFPSSLHFQYLHGRVPPNLHF